MVTRSSSKTYILLVLAFVLIMASKSEPQELVKPIFPATVKKLAEGNLEFSLNLYQAIAKQNQGENVIFSPFSITIALQMANAGARNSTAQELNKCMKLQELETEDEIHAVFSSIMHSLAEDKQQPFTLHTANRVYVNQNFKIMETFVNTLVKHYLADAISADFAGGAETTRKGINSWVEEVTHQKIQNLIPAGILDDLTRVILVNAIYFKGMWGKKFDPKETYEGKFHRKSNDIVQTKLMRNKARFPFAHDSDLNCKILEMSYVGNRLAMYVILPEEVDGLGSLEKKLTPDSLKSLIVSTHEQKVNVILPKFKLELGLSLKDVLRSLGIQEIFLQDKANFTGISSEEQLHVSHVLHKAFVEVNEEGTEAAAATAVRIMARSLVIVPDFIADHPFLFLIYDKFSEFILFMGRVTDPVSEAQAKKDEL